MNDLYNRIENIYQKGFDFFKLNWRNILKYTTVYYIISQVLSSLALVLSLLVSGNLTSISSLASLVNVSVKITDFVNTSGNEVNSQALSRAVSFVGILGVAVILAVIIGLPFLVNQYHSILQLTKKIVTPIFDFNKDYPRIIINFVSYFIVVFLGSLLLILPGIYLAIRLSPVLFISVEESLGLDGTFKKAWSLTDGNFWVVLVAQLLPLIALSIISSFLTSAGEINSIFGYILTIPMILIGIIASSIMITNSLMIYTDLKTQKNIAHN